MELRFVLEVLWRQRMTLLRIFAFTFLTVMGLTLVTVPSFDATAKVYLRAPSSMPSLMDALGLPSSVTSSDFSDTDRADFLELSYSKPVVEGMINELDLKRKRVRARVMDAIPMLRPLLSLIGVDVEAGYMPMTYDEVMQPSLTALIFSTPSIEVSQQQSSNILQINAESPVPEEAQQMANSVARLFIDTERALQQNDYRRAQQFLLENMGSAKQGYLDAVELIERFKEEERVLTLDTETDRLVNRVTDLKKDLDDLNSTIQQTNATMAVIKNQLDKTPKYDKSSESIAANDEIKSLRATLRELYIEQAASQGIYTPDHKNMVAVAQKITEAKRLLQMEAEKIFSSESTGRDPLYTDLVSDLSSSYTDLAGHELQQDILPAQIRDYEDQIIALMRKEKEYSQLELDITTKEEIFQSFFKFNYQLGLMEKAVMSDVYLLEPAVAPRPDDSRHRHPSMFLNLVIAVFLGGIFSIMGVLILHYVNDTVMLPRELYNDGTTKFLGSIPDLNQRIEGHPLLFLFEAPIKWFFRFIYRLGLHGLALVGIGRDVSHFPGDDLEKPLLITPKAPSIRLWEAFRALRAKLRLSALGEPLSCLVTVSPSIGNGSSFFAANLGIAISLEGRRVVVVEANLHRPALVDMFSVPSELAGLTDVLDGSIALSDALWQDQNTGLTLLTAGSRTGLSAHYMESSRLRMVCDGLQKEFDVVIIDAPALNLSGDGLLLAEWTQGLVLIVESGRTKLKHVQEVRVLAAAANVPVLGMVLNRLPDAEGLLS